GPLFAVDLPQLEGDPPAMAKVRTIVIGVEGRGAGRWRKAFGRDAERWQVPSDVHTGWYFIRLCDAEDHLIDSLDFRYIAGLKSIDVKGVGLETGFDTAYARVTFQHDETTSVRVADSTLSGMPHTRAVHGRSTVFEWQHHPDVRKPAFEVRDGGHPVFITLDADIIWWALLKDIQEPGPAWRASPIDLTSADFDPTSSSELFVRFPSLSGLNAFVGFSNADRRKLTIADATASVHLYGFSDASELRTFGRRELKLWVRGEDGEIERTIASVAAQIKCPWCEFQGDQTVLLDHLLAQHHDHCFERLKLRGEGVDGPDAIFVCLVSGCGQYYPDSRLPEENPITRLGRHSNERHPTNMTFKKISNHQDISNLLGLREKWVWKC